MLDLLVRESADTFETRDAAMRPGTFDPAGNTIEAVIATDAPIARHDARGEYVEILDVGGADLAALRGASVLDAHRRDGVAAILGTVDDVWREGPQLAARLRVRRERWATCENTCAVFSPGRISGRRS